MSKQFVQPAILAAILAIIGIVSIWTQLTWLVPSLGSAALVQILTPDVPGARPWNIAVGQFMGVAGGFGGVFLTTAVRTPIFVDGNRLDGLRVLAVVVAILITALLQLPAKAKSAAGGTIAMLLALGFEPATWASVFELLVGILSVTLLGEVGRKYVLSME